MNLVFEPFRDRFHVRRIRKKNDHQSSRQCQLKIVLVWWLGMGMGMDIGHALLAVRLF